MRIPSATYRIQFNPNFGFSAAQNIVSYLKALGISDLYASPILKARTGSNHGYDVVDYNQINPELGTEEEFKALVTQLQQEEMGWLQDIVPNHMAYDSQNQFLMDVLEHGPHSDYFDYFDIDWEHPYADIKGRVLTPLLGDFYGNCLERGEIQLQYDREGFSVNYYQLETPLRIESYGKLITYKLEDLSESLGAENPDFIKLLGVLYIVTSITEETEKKQRKDRANFVKAILWELYQSNSKIEDFIHGNIEIFNGEVGHPETFNLLDELLSEQFFRLSFWKVGAEELNYRRFFTINELICLKNENDEVFENTHNFIIDLVNSGQINGLRIDHIDGLYNPQKYLQKLKEEVGETYIVVEKIIELEKEYFGRYQELPSDWPIQGTSGYDFLNCINSLFCYYQEENYRKFTDIYARFTGQSIPYDRVASDNKRLIADKNLAGDVENLANLLKIIAGKYRYSRDFTLNGLRKAILEVLVFFPIYRTYIDSEEIRDSDRDCILEVIQKAKRQVPQLINEIEFIEKILLLDWGDFLPEEDQSLWLHFVMKFQQVSGPLTAKGVEDTALYVYNRLIALNEVGGTPNLFGISASVFHNFNQKRQDRWPHAMNASSTHDTKRSEDIRARIDVISEIPEQWEAEVTTWSYLNQPYRIEANGHWIPDPNDEYFLYQTLVGAFPFFEDEYPEFVERIKSYIVKAVREAKVHTAWLRPDTDYEEGFVTFVEKILTPSPENPFLDKLRAFQKQIAHYGRIYSLSQVLLKIASPGVPDFYQGTELWDLSLVDPDNRRPVNFEQRRSWLADIQQRAETDILGLMADLMADPRDGRIKLFLIARLLAVRNHYLEVFQQGAYIPLQVGGSHQDRALAFARHYRGTTAIAIAPRFLTSLVEPGDFPLGERLWKDTWVEIPQGLCSSWQDGITGLELTEGESISVGQALEYFPVALLIGERRD